MLAGSAYSQREGILLERDGKWAEASPLPGFSGESIEDVIAAFRGEREAPPSLQFALSSLDEPAIDELEVPWNALLVGDEVSLLSSLEQAIDAGCRAVKLKVARQDLDRDIERVKAVAARLPQQMALRLDANQAWTFAEAERFIRGIGDVDLEYLEEPLSDPSQLESLYAETGVRYALDESLLAGQDVNQHYPNAAALVCKPTILGGRAALDRLAKFGKPMIFSAAFESGVGIARIVQLAADYSPSIPAGLDTLDWLSEDLLLDSPRKRGGMFCVSGEPMVSAGLLERIEL